MNSIVKSIQKCTGSKCNEASKRVMWSLSIKQLKSKYSCHISNHWSWKKVRYIPFKRFWFVFQQGHIQWIKMTVKTFKAFQIILFQINCFLNLLFIKES